LPATYQLPRIDQFNLGAKGGFILQLIFKHLAFKALRVSISASTQPLFSNPHSRTHLTQCRFLTRDLFYSVAPYTLVSVPKSARRISSPHFYLFGLCFWEFTSLTSFFCYSPTVMILPDGSLFSLVLSLRIKHPEHNSMLVIFYSILSD
jgi:hypothetical protein